MRFGIKYGIFVGIEHIQEMRGLARGECILPLWGCDDEVIVGESESSGCSW